MRSLFLLALALAVLVGCDEFREKDSARLDKIAGIYEKGDYGAVITELTAYLEDFPRDAHGWTILGHAYERVDQNDKAQAAYESAIAINPRQFQAITGLGILHRKRKDYDAAMRAYEKAVEIDPQYAHAYSSMATIALKRNQDKKALEYAQKGYDLDKTDPVIVANLAVCYHYNDDIKNRDHYARIAAELGYPSMEAMQQIFSGELTVRD